MTSDCPLPLVTGGVQFSSNKIVLSLLCSHCSKFLAFVSRASIGPLCFLLDTFSLLVTFPFYCVDWMVLMSLSCIRHHVLSHAVWHHLRHSSFDECIMHTTSCTVTCCVTSLATLKLWWAYHAYHLWHGWRTSYSPRPIFQEDTTLSKFP